MAKVPIAGGTKTRLAREVGVATALRFARHTTMAMIRRLAGDPRWRAIVAIAPDTGVCSRFFPGQISRCAQGRGDMGQRMQRLLGGFPPGPVIVVGTDIPGVTPRAVATAFRRLGSCDAVFGPAVDGGFWLVGFARRRRSPSTFGNVRWSSPYALSDTLASLRGYDVGFTDILQDIDSKDDLERIGRHFGRLIIQSPRPDFEARNGDRAPEVVYGSHRIEEQG